MSYRVRVREQVWKFHGRLGLEDRRAVKRGIMQLTNEHGDIRYLPGRVIECVYMNNRALVYDVFESELHRIVTQKPPDAD